MTDDELKDAAHGAFESAMAFGVDRHAFERLARTVRDAEREACAAMLDVEAGRLEKRGIYIEDVERLHKMAAAMRSNVLS